MSVKVEADGRPWYHDIEAYIKNSEYPFGATDSEKKFIRCMACQFFFSREVLYKRNHDSIFLRWIDAFEANHLMEEMHEGLLGAHASGPLLACKIMRAGYYCLSMKSDCIKHVRTCHRCQVYQDRKNAPPHLLHSLAEPWPFSALGMDVIRLVIPKASNGHEYILMAIDYFTKWVEAALYKSVTQAMVARFQKHNIICPYSMPGELIIDNGVNLNGKIIQKLCQQFKIKHRNLDPYRPQMNGAVEAANKNIKKILVKMIDTYKDWHEYLPFALCAYRTFTELSEAEWAYSRYEQLNMIDEKRMTVMCLGQLYQCRVERAFNKKVRPRVLEKGDLVLKKHNQAMPDHRGKFTPTYEGPYVVKKAFFEGASILADMDGHDFNMATNSDTIIWYFA
ncbi:uncharacterized protein LOC142639707 [Castanea sativa]|uniref:uncharacterized protein LOC142639707 n=1 Tax=Castanea sativa TaxID=21020 RepID=UPI003F64F29A